MKSNVLRLIAAMIATFAMVGTTITVSAQDEATPVPYTAVNDPGSLSGSIVADGSSTVGPITEAVAEDFQSVAGDVTVQVDISGTGGGFKRFCAGETDFSDASRPIKDEEAAICNEAGIEYEAFEVAYDGIAIVVNPENDWVDCLTVDQLNKMWAPDSTISKWSDLDASWPEESINLYGPGTDSGTFDYFTGEIVGEEGSSRTDYTPSEDDNVLVAGVAGDQYALGFFGLAYYEQNMDSLKLLGVDNGNGCITPSADTVRDLTYEPLSRPLFVYVSKTALERPEVQEFLRYYIANAGSLATDVGYVPSPNATYVADQARLEGLIAGTVPFDSEATPAA